jgi:phage-related protein
MGSPDADGGHPVNRITQLRKLAGEKAHNTLPEVAANYGEAKVAQGRLHIAYAIDGDGFDQVGLGHRLSPLTGAVALATDPWAVNA